jgi:hypothetical protein
LSSLEMQVSLLLGQGGGLENQGTPVKTNENAASGFPDAWK